jgi:hypothetical protein
VKLAPQIKADTKQSISHIQFYRLNSGWNFCTTLSIASVHFFFNFSLLWICESVSSWTSHLLDIRDHSSRFRIEFSSNIHPHTFFHVGKISRRFRLRWIFLDTWLRSQSRNSPYVLPEPAHKTIVDAGAFEGRRRLF